MIKFERAFVNDVLLQERHPSWFLLEAAEIGGLKYLKVCVRASWGLSQNEIVDGDWLRGSTMKRFIYLLARYHAC